MKSIFKKSEGIAPKPATEKENSALIFISFLVGIGLLGIVVYVYQDYVCAKINRQISYAYSMLATLCFVSGALFTFSSLIGFLFGIPRPKVIDDSEKFQSKYIGNDNLLQVSDWLTKIILGLGLTQITKVPDLLRRMAGFITNNTHVSNQALIVLIVLYFSCLGFLFGYLWTRLYFIRMLEAADRDVNGSNVQLKAHINADGSASISAGAGADKETGADALFNLQKPE